MGSLLTLLSPFAPHIAEELWEIQGFGGGLACQQKWPEYDPAKTVDTEVEMAVQVNGKLRSAVTVPTDSDEKTVLDAAMADEKVAKFMEGMEIVKTIVVKNKLVNIILKPAK
jgi:leucyl-tRNA synthetase